MRRNKYFQQFRYKGKSLSAILLGFILNACQTTPSDSAPDVRDIDIQLKINRFEQDFFALDTSDIPSGLKQLRSSYGEFADIYFTRIVPAFDPRIAVNGPESYIKGFISHPEIKKLHAACREKYQDFSLWEKDFAQAFRYLKYYFPDIPTPELTTFISEYSIGCFIYQDQSLAIGLDFFLGADYPYQKFNPENPNFSQYLTRTFNGEHLVLKTLLPLVADLAGPPPGEKLLDHIIHNGKQLLVLEKLLPQTPDSIRMEVTAAQSEWLTENEKNIWAFFLGEDLLYNSDWQKIRKYVEYSPGSPGMPAEAPGRTGNWIGWQIARAYLKKYPSITLPELLALKDSQEFLERSGYKPPR
ncbi:MAG: hypothetical protein ACOYOO_05650 [Saprospiraceae bacterium]|jgi:hypothetical protein